MTEIKLNVIQKNKLNFKVQNPVIEVKPSLENLEVTPSGETQIFTHPDSYGYDEVKVNAISLQEKNVTPSKNSQEVVADENYSGLAKVVVNGDNNLVSENIKEGKTIFGVEGSAKTIGYEYADFDPVDIMQLLDEDTENYPSKLIVLLVNSGTNSYQIRYSDAPFNSGDVVVGSDGQQITVKGVQTYTFDDTKDLINSYGQRVRYFIVYKNKRTMGTNDPRFKSDVLMWYMKNCQYVNTGNAFKGNYIKAVEFDSDCTLVNTSQNVAVGSPALQKFEMPNNTIYSGVTVLTYSFPTSYQIKKAKLNLANVVTSLERALFGDSALEELYLFNCPEAEVDCAYMTGSCYILKKIVATPFLKPANNGNLFSPHDGLIELSGIDFSAFTTSMTFTGHNLTKIENIKNIATIFNVSSHHLLTHDSLMNIINALVDLTGQTPKTLNIGAVNIAKLTSEEIAIATNKNWSVS
jgi:hypothetical protein